jgi:hypothetical protein
VLATWQGAAALKLAQLIDSGKHGTSGAAQNVKAHREAMAVALAAAAKEADVISLIFRDDASQQLDEPHGGPFYGQPAKTGGSLFLSLSPRRGYPLGRGRGGVLARTTPRSTTD